MCLTIEIKGMMRIEMDFNVICACSVRIRYNYLIAELKWASKCNNTEMKNNAIETFSKIVSISISMAEIEVSSASTAKCDFYLK